MVTRFRVLEALLKMMKKITRKIVKEVFWKARDIFRY